MDRWATPEENMQAAARMRGHHENREQEKMKRKKLAPWVSDVIERHSGVRQSEDGIGSYDDM